MKDAHHNRTRLRREAEKEIIETAAHHAHPDEAWLERHDDLAKSDWDEHSEALTEGNRR